MKKEMHKFFKKLIISARIPLAPVHATGVQSARSAYLSAQPCVRDCALFLRGFSLTVHLHVEYLRRWEHAQRRHAWFYGRTDYCGFLLFFVVKFYAFVGSQISLLSQTVISITPYLVLKLKYCKLLSIRLFLYVRLSNNFYCMFLLVSFYYWKQQIIIQANILFDFKAFLKLEKFQPTHEASFAESDAENDQSVPDSDDDKNESKTSTSTSFRIPKSQIDVHEEDSWWKKDNHVSNYEWTNGYA